MCYEIEQMRRTDTKTRRERKHTRPAHRRTSKGGRI